MLDQLLAKLGFTQKEAEVYLALLSYGKMSPAELAKLTRISRPTIYSVSKELVKKGVLFEDLGGSSLLLVAKKPEDFMVVINREQKKLDEKKLIVEQAITELQKVAQATKYSIPKIVFIPEEEIESYLYKKTEEWDLDIFSRDGIYWAFQDHTFVESYQQWIDWYWTRASPKMLINLLTNESHIEEVMATKGHAQRHARFWKNGGQFTATTWVMGDYVTMVVTNQRPHYLVEIHDKMFAQNFRILFKGIWKSLD